MKIRIDERLVKYFKDAVEIFDALDIDFGPIDEVTVSNAKSTWGTCRYDRVNGVFSLKISSMLLEDGVAYKDVMDTMLHELLHCHENRMCHTGEWKTYANLINKEYGYNIKRATKAAEKNIDMSNIDIPKYIVSCDGCGAVNKYRRKGKVVKALMKNPVGTCRCTICGGNSFTVTEC